jgi:hypothetical protein
MSAEEEAIQSVAKEVKEISYILFDIQTWTLDFRRLITLLPLITTI